MMPALQTLSELVESQVVDDNTIIRVYSPRGKFIAEGHWFQDQILDFDWFNARGTAVKLERGKDGAIVFFKFA